MLLNNNYPIYYIRRTINNFLNKQNLTNEASAQRRPPAENKKFCRLVFYPDLSYKLCDVFRQFGFTVAFYNIIDNNKIFFSGIKDKIPPEKQSGVVYEIACSNCEKVYVGQTKQYLGERLKQHKKDAANIQSDRENKTALTQHIKEEGHNFNFNNVKILDRERTYSKRLISEMIFIRKNNSVNFREDTNNLSKCYDCAVSRIMRTN